MPPAPPRTPAPHAYPVLDGLRGVAALAVACRHAPCLWGSSDGPAGPGRESYLAVDLFFVLSGFVLEHAYRARIDAGLKPLAFVRLRLRRLYPLYGLGLIAALAALLATGQLDGGAGWPIATAALFLPTPANYPAWSLFFELAVNLLFVAVGRRLTGRWLALVVLGSGAILWGAALGGHAGFAGSLDAGAAWRGLAAGTLRVLFGFWLGVLLCRVQRAVRLPPVRPAVPIAGLAAVLLCCPPAPWRALFDLGAVTLAFPALVILAARAGAGGRPGLGPMRWLGTTSYAVYVLQAPVFFAAAALARGLAADPPAWCGAAAVLALLALSHLATVLVDAPVRRWLGAARAPRPDAWFPSRPARVRVAAAEDPR